MEEGVEREEGARSEEVEGMGGLPPHSLNLTLKSCLQTNKASNYREKKMSSGKKFNDVTLLCKLLAEPSCLHPPTMACADYRSSILLLPTMPSPDRSNGPLKTPKKFQSKFIVSSNVY
jgi:hypothetical protein